MNQLQAPPRLDWQVYLGHDLFTADNQRVGIVVDVRTDPRSRELYLIVQDRDNPSESTLCVPSEVIGIATRFRLMLELVSDRLPRDEWTQRDFRFLNPA